MSEMQLVYALQTAAARAKREGADPRIAAYKSYRALCERTGQPVPTLAACRDVVDRLLLVVVA